MKLDRVPSSPRQPLVTGGQASLATLLSAALLFAVAAALDRLSAVVLLDLAGCLLLAAALLASERLGRRSRAAGGRAAGLLGLTGSLAVLALGGTVAVSYAFELAEPPSGSSASSASSAATNITIHCESGEVNVGPPAAP